MSESFNPLDKAVFNNSHRLENSLPEDMKIYVEQFWSNKELLYQAALAERQRVIDTGLNWRGFGVGAAALAVNTATGESTIITGYNSKEAPDSQKHCAEKRLFTEAINQGYDKIAGLIVVAEHQADDRSQLPCTTLHPCSDCRDLLATSPLAYPELPIITMSIPPPADEIQGEYSPLEEQHSLSELVTKHQTNPSAE